MEKIFRNVASRPAGAGPLLSDDAAGHPWREALPAFAGGTCSLREPTPADAAALLMALGPQDLRECAPLAVPPTIAGMETLVECVREHRRAGTAAAWAIVPAGAQDPAGLLVVRALDRAFTMVGLTAAVAAELRGTGLFQDAARCLLDGLFGAFGVHRIEARVEVGNARANGALRKLGASQEGVLRRAQYRDGAYRDQLLWAMVAGDGATSGVRERPRVH